MRVAFGSIVLFFNPSARRRSGANKRASCGKWEQLEQSAREAFANSYGEHATPAAQEIGRDLQTRLVFGWAALREKLLLAENNLDDVTFELVKIALLRGMEQPPLSNDSELRLVTLDESEGELEVASILSQDEALI